MKYFSISLGVAAFCSSLAFADIQLNVGNSVTVGGQKISCGGGASGLKHWTCQSSCYEVDGSIEIAGTESPVVGEGPSAALAFKEMIYNCRYGKLSDRATIQNSCIQD